MELLNNLIGQNGHVAEVANMLNRLLRERLIEVQESVQIININFNIYHQIIPELSTSNVIEKTNELTAMGFLPKHVQQVLQQTENIGEAIEILLTMEQNV